MDWAETNARRDEKHLSVWIQCLILEIWPYNHWSYNSFTITQMMHWFFFFSAVNAQQVLTGLAASSCATALMVGAGLGTRPLNNATMTSWASSLLPDWPTVFFSITDHRIPRNLETSSRWSWRTDTLCCVTTLVAAWGRWKSMAGTARDRRRWMLSMMATGIHCRSSNREWWVTDHADIMLHSYLIGACFSINSLLPGKCDCNFESIISEYMLPIRFINTFYKIALRWIPQNTFDNKLTLVRVIAWCQCWSRSMSPYGITRPQWVNILS